MERLFLDDLQKGAEHVNYFLVGNSKTSLFETLKASGRSDTLGKSRSDGSLVGKMEQTATRSWDWSGWSRNNAHRLLKTGKLLLKHVLRASIGFQGILK